MPLEKSRDAPQNFELSFATARPFDFHAWLATWQREYLFFRIDAENRINFVAPSVRHILGYEPEEMVGRDYREFFDLDHPLQAQLVDLSDRLKSSDPPGLRRCVARRRDGDPACFALRERDVPATNGLAGKEVMGQDITARVEAELSLRQSERKYRRLIEGLKSDYIIYARDPQGHITYVSPSVKKVLGYQPDEIMGRNVRELYVDLQQGQETVDRILRDAEAGKLLHRFTEPMRHADGGARVLEIQERPVYTVDGRLAAMEGIAKDVTEAAAAAAEISKLKDDLERRVSLRTEQLQRSNEQLRASEARYRNVVDTQSDFIVRCRPDGTRTFVNDAYCAFQSKSPCELLGRKILPLVHPDDRRAFHDMLASISPDHPLAAFEGRVLRKDESYSWMQWNTRGFFDDQGQVAEYQSVGRDVSQLRAAADLLRQKEVHLAHLSRLATMGEMVAGIAHEINQPLHAAKTFAEAARRNLQSGGAERIDTAINCMTEISDAVTRTVQIIRRLREFTKAQPFELESLSINHVVNEALQLAAYEIRRVGATLRLDLGKSLPAISGDRIQLEQLLVNLLLNACEAMEPMPAGQRILQIQSRLDGEDIRLAIIDAGVGVADPSRLFEPFFTTKSGGMGMGMVLCKSIAEAHGIDLGFENNQEGPGATFILTIPAAGARSS